MNWFHPPSRTMKRSKEGNFTIKERVRPGGNKGWRPQIRQRSKRRQRQRRQRLALSKPCYGGKQKKRRSRGRWRWRWRWSWKGWPSSRNSGLLALPFGPPSSSLRCNLLFPARRQTVKVIIYFIVIIIIIVKKINPEESNRELHTETWATQSRLMVIHRLLPAGVHDSWFAANGFALKEIVCILVIKYPRAGPELWFDRMRDWRGGHQIREAGERDTWRRSLAFSATPGTHGELARWCAWPSPRRGRRGRPRSPRHEGVATVCHVSWRMGWRPDGGCRGIRSAGVRRTRRFDRSPKRNTSPRRERRIEPRYCT